MATHHDLLVQEVDELTAMLRTEDGFRVLREALSAAGLDPGSVLLGGLLEDAEGYESGLIVASSGRALEYEFDWRQPRPLVRWGPADEVPELLRSYEAAEVAIAMASDLPDAHAAATASPDPLEVAVAVLNSGGSPDDAAIAMVDLGIAPIPAIKALRAAAGIDLGRAKAIVHPHLPEATQRSAEQLWDTAEAALREVVEDGDGDPTYPLTVASTWVVPGNVKPLAATISMWTGYDFDDADWAAIEFGLEGTDADRDRWFTYPIVGSPPLDLMLARHVDADPVMVRIVAGLPLTDELVHKLDAAATIFNCFTVN